MNKKGSGKLPKQEKLRAKKEIVKLKFELDYQENLNKIAAPKKNLRISGVIDKNHSFIKIFHEHKATNRRYISSNTRYTIW